MVVREDSCQTINPERFPRERIQNMKTYQPTHEEITLRAQEIWNAEGQPVGRDGEIWLSAEQQLKSKSRVSGSREQPLPAARTNDEASSIEEDADPIGNNKVEERLASFGAPRSRGVTSL